jgi:hypothetical protein
MSDARTERLAELNDLLRTTFSPTYGKVYISRGVAALPGPVRCEVLKIVQAFDKFDDVPEREFGHFYVGDLYFEFTITDYYRLGAPDPYTPIKLLLIKRTDES